MISTDIVPDSERSGFSSAPTPCLRLAQLTFLLFVLSLAWMKTPVNLRGLGAIPADFIFLLALSLWFLALWRKEARFRFHKAYWLLVFYFAAMALSAFYSDDPQRSAFKLLTQAYLLAFPVLTFNLVRTSADLRRLFGWWVAGAAAVASVGVATLLLFPLLGPDSILAWTLHNFGTLPPGPYPRLELSFSFPSTLANYLGATLMLLLIGYRLCWFSRSTTIVIGAAIVLSAFFALTPSFGSILFSLGGWFWYLNRDRSPKLARAVLLTGCAMPIAAVLLASATPIMHPTAPFLFHVPGLDVPLAPSVRLLAWMEAAENFLASPIVGIGIGLEAVDVHYEASGCSVGCVTDAHNTFLNFGVQTGLVGLAASVAIIAFAVRQMVRAASKPHEALLFGLAIAWICGFVMMGLVGSFEDARHLWVLFGLLLCANAAACEPMGQQDELRLRPGR
ncbi:MAG: O-antigen ligase family protein [Sphingomonas sp.]|nr:O-antigen ligase family protein [Sphingomonas sp.]